MKHVQNIRGRWTIRMLVPEELWHVFGRNERVQIGLHGNARAFEKTAISIANGFLAQAPEVWESLREASVPTHQKAAPKRSTDAVFLRDGRSTCANRLRLPASA